MNFICQDRILVDMEMIELLICHCPWFAVNWSGKKDWVPYKASVVLEKQTAAS